MPHAYWGMEFEPPAPEQSREVKLSELVQFAKSEYGRRIVEARIKAREAFTRELEARKKALQAGAPEGPMYKTPLAGTRVAQLESVMAPPTPLQLLVLEAKSKTAFEKQVNEWQRQTAEEQIKTLKQHGYFEKPRERPKSLSEQIYGLFQRKHVQGLLPGPPLPEQFYPEVYHPMAPLAGFIAAFEAPIYSFSYLLASEERKQFIPEPPPTLVGGIVGAALGSPEELEKARRKGGAYMYGTVVGDIFLSYIISYAGKRIFGVRGRKIKSVDEITVETHRHGEVFERKMMRAAKVATKTERVPYEYSKWAQEFQQFVQPTHVELGGKTLTVVETAGRETAKETAESVIRGPAYIYAAAKKPWLEIKFLTTPVQETVFVEYARHGMVGAFGKSLEASASTVETTFYKVGIYKAVQTFGKVEPSVYLRYAKTMPPGLMEKLYPQIGGLPVSMLETTESAIPVAMRYISIEPPSRLFTVGFTAASLAILHLPRTSAAFHAKTIASPETNISLTAGTVPGVYAEPKSVSMAAPKPVVKQTAITTPQTETYTEMFQGTSAPKIMPRKPEEIFGVAARRKGRPVKYGGFMKYWRVAEPEYFLRGGRKK